MKKCSLFLIFLLFLFTAEAQSYFNVGQFNIRYANKEDAALHALWQDRSQKIVDMINFEHWEIFGAQEVLYTQLEDLAKGLEGYDYIGVGRDDGKTDGEFAPIFYRKDRMRCLDKGVFWISETPDVAGSKGWDASHCRICTWGKFEDKNTKWQFWFFNLHLDHKGETARREGVRLVLSKIKEMSATHPYILTGDFNVDQNSEVYNIITESGLLKDTYQSARYRMAEIGTTNAFDTDHWTPNRIDHIFVSPEFTTHEYGILTYNWWEKVEPAVIDKKGKRTDCEKPHYEARVLSDHYPVEARVELPRLRSHQDWTQYSRYEESNKSAGRPRVVFMGNSITDNWYRYHKEFFTGNNYLCRGIGGQVTAQMLARFRSDVINLKPETVVILAGTNDIAMNQGFVSIEHIYENIVSMSELAQFNGIKVVICSVLPADGYSWSWEVGKERTISSIKELNRKLEEYAKANGLQYADYYSAMVDENHSMIKEFQQDPVHPNKEGYLVMEEIMQKILEK